jgi:hypothetical protein
VGELVEGGGFTQPQQLKSGLAENRTSEENVTEAKLSMKHFQHAEHNLEISQEQTKV